MSCQCNEKCCLSWVQGAIYIELHYIFNSVCSSLVYMRAQASTAKK